MIINKIDNTYIIKLLNKTIDIYNKTELEETTKKIIEKISKTNHLNNYIHLDFYLNKNYGTIIKLNQHKIPISKDNNKTVKITINTEATFLYQIDYFDIIETNIPIKKIYYYKDNFYLEIDKNIETKEYYKLLELSNIIYEDTYDIIDKAIKI